MIRKIKTNHLVPLEREEKRFAINNEILIDKNLDLYALDKVGREIKFYNEYIAKLHEDKVITKYKLYGIDIDMNNIDSTGCTIYTNDSKEFKPLSVNLDTGECDYGSWKDIIQNIFGVRPCIFSDRVLTYLDPDDYTKTIDGSSTALYDGNIMIEFKKMYYKFSVDNNILSFRVSDGEVDPTYITDAFLLDNGSNTINDYMYIAAYPTVEEDGKLKSVSGLDPYIACEYLNDLLSKVETSRYTILGYSKYLYLVGLTWLVSKSIETSKLGSGTGKYKTGLLDNKGLFFGTTDGPNKIFGIENIWSFPFLCTGLSCQNNIIYFLKNGPYLNTEPEPTDISIGSIPSGGFIYGYPTNFIKDGNIIFPSGISLEKASIDHFHSMCIYVNDLVNRYTTIEYGSASLQFHNNTIPIKESYFRLTFC